MILKNESHQRLLFSSWHIIILISTGIASVKLGTASAGIVHSTGRHCRRIHAEKVILLLNLCVIFVKPYSDRVNPTASRRRDTTMPP